MSEGGLVLFILGPLSLVYLPKKKESRKKKRNRKGSCMLMV